VVECSVAVDVIRDACFGTERKESRKRMMPIRPSRNQLILIPVYLLHGNETKWTFRNASSPQRRTRGGLNSRSGGKAFRPGLDTSGSWVTEAVLMPLFTRVSIQSFRLSEEKTNVDI
jgi:hypothetical protein